MIAARANARNACKRIPPTHKTKPNANARVAFAVRSEERNAPKWKKSPLAQCWLRQSERVSAIVKSEAFETMMHICIVTTAVLSGLETYEGMRENEAVKFLNYVIFYSFALECVLKIIAEGLDIKNYWIGSNWKWNNFDFFIVICLFIPIDEANQSITVLLYILRLMRLLKIIEKVPQLQTILMGLIGGISSAGYILLLLFLVFYLYAIVALYLFRKNNHWHYRNLETALLTLFRASTLEDWTDIMYTDVLGCDQFESVYVYEENFTPDNEEYWCSNPKTSYFIAPIFWISFIVISSLVILSLFVASITNNMAMSIHQMKLEEEEMIKEKMKKKQMNRMLDKSSMADIKNAKSFHAKLRRSSLERVTIFLGLVMTPDERATAKKKMANLLRSVWTGLEFIEPEQVSIEGSFPRVMYWHLAKKCQKIVHHRFFNRIVTMVIIFSGIIAGVQTDEEFASTHTAILDGIESFIIGIFTMELALKFIAEDLYPLRVFLSGWNIFDFIVVVGSFALSGDSQVGDLLIMLRLLRLLRVLKLIRAFPQLQVLVNALITGFTSISFIGALLLFVIYAFAIMGVVLFSENDPWHFGSLHVTILTLFRCATLDDWADVMYINILGCDRFGYSDWPEKCVSPKPGGVFAVFYFLIFTTISSLVLLTLFIGVVTTSMDRAQEKQNQERRIEERIKEFQEKENLTSAEINQYRAAFNILDLDGGGTVEEEELRIGLNAVGMEPTDVEIDEVMRMVDRDSSGEIDLADFIAFMVLEKKRTEGKNNDNPGEKAEKGKCVANQYKSFYALLDDQSFESGGSSELHVSDAEVVSDCEDVDFFDKTVEADHPSMAEKEEEIRDNFDIRKSSEDSISVIVLSDDDDSKFPAEQKEENADISNDETSVEVVELDVNPKEKATLNFLVNEEESHLSEDHARHSLNFEVSYPLTSGDESEEEKDDKESMDRRMRKSRRSTCAKVVPITGI